MPVFKGARQLLECLEQLTRRPRQREAPLPVGRARSGVSAQGIPLLCLKRPNDGGALADGLARYLKEAEPRRIPHVLYRYPQPGGNDLEVLSAALMKIARDLASGSNAAGGRIRFTRFGLVLWLIRQDLGATSIRMPCCAGAYATAISAGPAPYPFSRTNCRNSLTPQ